MMLIMMIIIRMMMMLIMMIIARMMMMLMKMLLTSVVPGVVEYRPRDDSTYHAPCSPLSSSPA